MSRLLKFCLVLCCFWSAIPAHALLVSTHCKLLISRVISYSHPKRELKSIANFRVGTLNLTDLHFNETREGIKGPKTDEQMDRLGTTILNSKSDLIVLQEVIEKDALVRLVKENLDYQYDIFFTDTNDGANRAIAYLVKKDLPLQVNLYSNRNHPSYFTAPGARPDPVFSRNFPFLEIRTMEQSSESTPLLTVFGTHYSRIVSGEPQRSIQRAEQIRTSADILKEYEELYPRKPFIVLAGDFNANITRADNFEDLRRVGMVDTAALMGVPVRDRISHVQGKKLDGIMVNSAFVDPAAPNKKLVTRSKVHNYENSRDQTVITVDDQSPHMPSTHFLVTADLQFPAIYKATIEAPATLAAAPQKRTDKVKVSSAAAEPPKPSATEVAKRINEFIETTFLENDVMRLPDGNHPGLSAEAKKSEAELRELLESTWDNDELWSGLDVDSLRLVGELRARSEPKVVTAESAFNKLVKGLDLSEQQKTAVSKVEVPDQVMGDLEALNQRDRERVVSQIFLRIGLNGRTGMWKDWGTDTVLGSERIQLQNIEYRVLFKLHNGRSRIMMIVPENDLKRLPARVREIESSLPQLLMR